MPIFTTHHAISAATGRNMDTVGRRLGGVPFIGKASNTSRLYHLAAVLPTLHRSEYACIPALFESATESGEFFVGNNVLPICNTFGHWADPAMTERLRSVQRRLTTTLAAVLQSSTIFDHLHNLHAKLVLVPGVLRFVVLNDPTRLPDLSTASAFTLQWSITNAVFESETV